LAGTGDAEDAAAADLLQACIDILSCSRMALANLSIRKEAAELIRRQIQSAQLLAHTTRTRQ
jgi:hypothetical protein